MVGLPTHLYRRQRNTLRDIVKHHVDVGELQIIPQAMGPYHAVMLAANGMPAPDRNMADEAWGVVEVGHFSTDFMVMKKGRWIQEASDVCSGARVAAARFQRLLAERGITVKLVQTEAALQSGRLRHLGENLDVTTERDLAATMLVAEVIDTAQRLMDAHVGELDGVIVAGGGASLVYKSIRAKWPHTIMADDSRFTVAEGMRRYGEGVVRVRAMLTAAA